MSYTITRVDLITPIKHPAMSASEMPRSDFSAQPPNNEPAYTFEDVGNAVRITRDGKSLRVLAGNIKGIVESEERAAPAKVKRA